MSVFSSIDGCWCADVSNLSSYAEQVGNDGEEVFFRLLEQMQSLLRKGDFPALK